MKAITCAKEENSLIGSLAVYIRKEKLIGTKTPSQI